MERRIDFMKKNFFIFWAFLWMAVAAVAALKTNLVFTGTVAGDGTGDPNRVAWQKVNTNLHDLDSRLVSVPSNYDLKFERGIDAAPVNVQALKRLRKKIYDGQKITLSFLGDSTGLDIQPVVEMGLLPFMGRYGAVFASSTPLLGGYWSTTATSGTSTPYAAGLSGVFWGPFSTLGNGAVFTYSTSISNVISANSAGAAWYQSSGFGSMLLEIQDEFGDWTSIATLNSSGGAGLTLVTTNIDVGLADWKGLRITSTGSNIPVATALRNTQSGIGFISSGTSTPGNPPLSFMQAAGSNNVAKFLLWQNPDVVFYKAERIDSDTNNIPWFHTLLTNTLPTCDLVLVSYHQNYNAAQSRTARDFFVSQANARGLAFVDGFAESQSFSNSVLNGLYSGDQVHLVDAGRVVIHSRLMPQLGLGINELIVLRRSYPDFGVKAAGTNDTSKAQMSLANTFTGVQTFQAVPPIVLKGTDASINMNDGALGASFNSFFRFNKAAFHFADSLNLYKDRLTITNVGGRVVLTQDKTGGNQPWPRLGETDWPWTFVATNVLYFNGVMDLSGAGSPESVIAAPVGSTWRRSDGGAGTSFYVKESGTGNTGWTAK